MAKEIKVRQLTARLIWRSRKIGLNTYQLVSLIHQGRIVEDTANGGYIIKSPKN